MQKEHKALIQKSIVFILAVTACLAFASRSSFLYPLNNWDDANSYFSVGKGIFNGKMPYRDIFDQKGMYLYFLYGIAYLISHTTFAGVFLLEVILGVADVALIYMIIKIYAGHKTSITLAIMVFGGIVSSRSFWWGGSAEEICLPFFLAGLYLFIDYFKNQYPSGVMSMRRVLLGGVMAGIVANIKFTGLGFFFAWMMLTFISFLVHKDFSGAIKACLVYLLGMFITFVPWIIYFGVQGGLYEWYWGYIHVNVFVYNKAGGDAGIFEAIKAMIKIFYWLIWQNWMYMFLVIAGLIATVLDFKATVLARISIVILFVFTFLGIFGGGRELPYYSLPLSIFAAFGGALLSHHLDKAVSNETIGFGFMGLPIFALMMALMQIATFSMNVPFMAQKRDDFFLYRFRDEVLETEDPTLLNVGCLDAGLYTLCDIVPSCRWFQTQTLDIDDPANNPYMEQERYVREGLIDYVLVRDSIPESIDDHYDLIDSEEYSSGDYDFMYYLYKKVR
ncbi:hypothetical protein [Butyrivibrio sp. VCB2006]|uniref:hypothetical protein n=1 Tax=Butyrivibrio sp. VCB2006 TaxID=1280679 RepID=UPI0003F50543|nr:hypothetical protein [Butyrivibrio sp. VCB2006]